MTDLTEQWKEGELDIGEVYYVKTERGVYKANGEYLNSASCIYGFDISYIIAPVPTYSEYLALQSDSQAKNEGAEIIAELEERLKKTQGLELDLRRKNHELKELLKEWAQFEIEENPNDFTVISERMSELAKKTKQALGEDK